MRENMKKTTKHNKIIIHKQNFFEEAIADYIASEGLVAFTVYQGHCNFPTQVGRIDNDGMPVVLVKEEYNRLREILNIPKNTESKRYYVDVDCLVRKRLLTHVGNYSQPEENTGYDFSNLKKIVHNREWTGVEDYLNYCG